VRLPNNTATPISAAAISAAGTSPAMNRPPIDRLATKPRMMRLMQGGMVSAITAEAASRGVGIVPGGDFLLDEGLNSFRLAYSAVPAGDIGDGVRRPIGRSLCSSATAAFSTIR